MTVLTAEQHQAVEQAGDQPIAIVDTQTKVAYYLVRADLFQEMSELLDEERQREVIAKKAKRNAAARLVLQREEISCSREATGGLKGRRSPARGETPGTGMASPSPVHPEGVQSPAG